MNIKIKRIQLHKILTKEEKDWNEVIDNSEDATIFHTPEWIRSINFNNHAHVIILIAYNQDKPVGVFPYYVKNKFLFFKRISTSAFETAYGGPVILGSFKTEVLEKIITKLLNDFRIISSVITMPPGKIYDNFKNNNFDILKNETLILDLNKEESVLWEGLEKMKIRNIEKSRKNEIIIEEIGSDKLSEFHLILKDTYERLGLPQPKPLSFYVNLFDQLASKGRVKFLIAYKGNIPVAGSVFLFFNREIIYWQGASLQEYWKYGVNDHIHWQLILIGVQKGFKKYNLLHFHDNKGKEIESLKKYKMGFGAGIENYYRVEKEGRIFSIMKKINI